MACNEDLTYRTLPRTDPHDLLLEQLRTTVREEPTESPVLTMLTLLMIDQHYGLAQEGDYVLVTPGMAGYLLTEVTPLDDKLRAALAAEINGSEDDQAELEGAEIKLGEFYDVRIESPEDDYFTNQYPEQYRRKTVKIRIMTEPQAERLSMMYTVHQDGSFIYRPGFRSQMGIYYRSLSDIPG
jgi:hypothetical protein